MAIQRSGRFERIKKPLKSDMNVVPYIDVMLVLLVIFMVTAPMITSGIKVDLPEANGTTMASKEPPAMVTLDKDGHYFLKSNQHDSNKPIELSELTAILSQEQQTAKSENKEFSVVIEGEKSRSYGDVMSLMKSLQDAGLTQVGLLTESVK